MRRIKPVRTELYIPGAFDAFFRRLVALEGKILDATTESCRRLINLPRLARPIHLHSIFLNVDRFANRLIYILFVALHRAYLEGLSTLADGVYEPEHKLPDIITTFFLKILYHVNR